MKTQRFLMSLGLLTGSLSLRCVPRAVFPTQPPVVVLPLRDPLLGPDPSVLVTLPGREGPWSAWMFPDSGVWGGAILPATWLARLGPQVVDRGGARVQFVNGPLLDARRGVLSTLTLGDLVVRDVPVEIIGPDSLEAREAILGDTILGHAPWEIDWDRGTLTLGADPWPDAPDVTRVPLRRRNGLDVVTVHVDGHPVEMVVDTGAKVSLIPADIGKEAGLSEHDVDRSSHFLPKACSGDTVLGALRLGRIEFASVPHSSVGYALLGRDVLSRYRIQVIPEKQLALRPRGDAWETAPQRIARWPWTHACPSAGCLRARIEPVGKDARLSFSLEADAPYPIELLLGCREADPVGSRLLTLSERLTSGRTRGPAYHLRLRVPSAPKDLAFETMVAGGNAWLSRTRCQEIRVLDIVPILGESTAGGGISATLEW